MRLTPLNATHDRQAFDCGRPALNDWLQRIARQHQDKGISRTFVAVADDAPERILGFYALTLAELDPRHLPESRRRKLPRRVPGIRLGRLAVSLAEQGTGLGGVLLVDALTRTRRIHAEAGGIGLFVDAIDEQAAAYYRRFGFAPSPDNPLLLYLPATVIDASPRR